MSSDPVSKSVLVSLTNADLSAGYCTLPSA